MVNTAEVGKETERRVAAAFRDDGWAGCERKVRTGFRTPTREVADQGDLTGLPGLCVQVKSLRSRDSRRANADPNAAAELMIPTWLDETEAQRVASGAALGLLVVRRWTTADARRWWCHLRVSTLQTLLTGNPEHPLPPGWPDFPVRLELGEAMAALKACGWGPDDAAVTA